MPIFHINNKKVLFVHIPKNYGTFIEDLLSKFSTTKLCNVNSVFNKELLFGQYNGNQYQHLTMKQIESLTNYKVDDFDIVFSLLRDPMERLISSINYRIDHEYWSKIYKNNTKDEIIKKVVDNYNKSRFSHDLTQLEFIKGYNNKITMFTCLSECVDFLKKQLNIDYNLDSMNKINKSKKHVTKEDIYRLYSNIDLILQDDINLYNSICN